MEETKHDINELHELQGLPLSLKISLTESRLRAWVNEWGLDRVYISFSGGKDSTVLLHIARKLFPEIKAMFINTGVEYPEIVRFVKTFDNVDIVKPNATFREVVQRWGYPFFSKEISNVVYYAKQWYETTGEGQSEVNMPIRVKKIKGILKASDGTKSKYNQKKWEFMLDAPFYIGSKCCSIIKHKPAEQYFKETGRYPILGMQASESMLRTQQWLLHGCNAWDMLIPQSRPLAFWTEQDILLYLKVFNVPICSVYGDIVVDGNSDKLVTQEWLKYGLFDENRLPLKTTKCDRTGCVFCGFGCHLEKESRFIRLHETHPKLYDYLMRPWLSEEKVMIDGKENIIMKPGLGYKEIIDWVNKHGNLSIQY